MRNDNDKKLQITDPPLTSKQCSEESQVAFASVFRGQRSQVESLPEHAFGFQTYFPWKSVVPLSEPYRVASPF